MIDLSTQLFALSISAFPDGSLLYVSYSKLKNAELYPRLGGAIALVVMPSYSFMKKVCQDGALPTSLWTGQILTEVARPR